MKYLPSATLILVLGLNVGANAWAQFDDFDVSLPAAARNYCHEVRFPQGWSTKHYDDHAPQRLSFGTEYSDYEFRVNGTLSTRFLVATFSEFVGTKYYTNNLYEVNLADATAPPIPADRKAWDDAAVVPLVRKTAFRLGADPPNGTRLEFHGFQFSPTGEIWAQPSRHASLLSPDQQWLVLQSTTRGVKTGSKKVFLDFFNADTGDKLFTIPGKFSSIRATEPDYGVLTKTGWVTERYFIIPLGRVLDRCLVCDFGRRAGPNL